MPAAWEGLTDIKGNVADSITPSSWLTCPNGSLHSFPRTLVTQTILRSRKTLTKMLSWGTKCKKLGHALGALIQGLAATYTTFWRLEAEETIFSPRILTEEALRKLWLMSRNSRFLLESNTEQRSIQRGSMCWSFWDLWERDEGQDFTNTAGEKSDICPSSWMYFRLLCALLLFSCSIVFDSLWSYGL